MTVPTPTDQPFSIHVVAADDVGPLAITVSNPSLASIGSHPDHADDPAWAQGTPTATEGAFVVNVTNGTLAAASDELDLQADAAPAQIEINLA